MADLKDILTEIDSIRAEIDNHDSEPEALTRLGMTLANLNVDIALVIPGLHALSTQVEIDIYLEKRAEPGSKVGDAQISGKNAKVQPRKDYELAKAVSKSIDRLLSTVTRRLEYLGEENRRTDLKDGRVVKREFKRPPAGESKPSPRHETAVITAEPTLEELKQQIATKLKGKVKTKEEMEDLLIPIIGVTVISTIEEAELVLEAIN